LIFVAVSDTAAVTRTFTIGAKACQEEYGVGLKATGTTCLGTAIGVMTVGTVFPGLKYDDPHYVVHNDGLPGNFVRLLV
jgi:hypothetical protein